MSWLKEFARFARRGNLVDLAIGFTVGAAFSTIAKSLVNDIVMPPLGLLMGRTDFSDHFWLLQAGAKKPPPYLTLADAQAAGAVTLNYGLFVNALLAFLVVALAMFVVVRLLNRGEALLEHAIDGEKPADGEPANKECPFCHSTVKYRATRCAHCTSELPEVPRPATATQPQPT